MVAITETLAGTPTPLMSCGFLKVPGHESGFMLGCIVVGGTGEPSHEVMHQLPHGGQEVREWILQLVGTLGNPQLIGHGGQKVHELILQLMGTRGNPELIPLGGHVLGGLTTQLSVPRRRHASGILPQRSRQAEWVHLVCIGLQRIGSIGRQTLGPRMQRSGRLRLSMMMSRPP